MACTPQASGQAMTETQPALRAEHQKGIFAGGGEGGPGMGALPRESGEAPKSGVRIGGKISANPLQ